MDTELCEGIFETSAGSRKEAGGFWSDGCNVCLLFPIFAMVVSTIPILKECVQLGQGQECTFHTGM